MSRGIRLSLAGATLAVIGVVVAMLPWQVPWTPETTEKPASTQRVDSAVEVSPEIAQTTETTKSPAAPATPQSDGRKPEPEAATPSTTPPPAVAPSQVPRPKKLPRFYASAEEQAGSDIKQRQNAVAALETPGEPIRGAQAPSPQPAPDGGVTPPIAIFQVQPQYTPEARLARIQGTIELVATVREDGTVKFERITQSLGYGLDEASAAAVEQWKFVPGKKNGQPVAVSTTLRFHFSLK